MNLRILKGYLKGYIHDDYPERQHIIKPTTFTVEYIHLYFIPNEVSIGPT